MSRVCNQVAIRVGKKAIEMGLGDFNGDLEEVVPKRMSRRARNALAAALLIVRYEGIDTAIGPVSWLYNFGCQVSARNF